MTAMKGVLRDERTVVVENASYRVAYVFITYALLVDVMYKSITRREASWELLGIVILGGAITTAFQWRKKILTRQSAMVALIASVVAAAVAAVVAFLNVLR